MSSVLPDPLPPDADAVQVATPSGGPIPFTQVPTNVGDVIVGLANSRPRGLSSEAGLAFLAGWATETNSERQEARQEIRDLRNQLADLARKLATESTTVAVLTERIGSATSARRRAAIALLAGTTLVGIAIELFRNSIRTPAYVLGFVGAVLIAVGCFDDGSRK